MNDIYIFKNNRIDRLYSIENVRFTIKKVRKPSTLVVGKFKEQLYKELLNKPKLRSGLIFYGINNAYKLVKFDYSVWEKGQYLPNEMLKIELEYSEFHTKKMQAQENKVQNNDYKSD